MTFVEFFEKDAAENICSCLTGDPDRVILIGDKLKLMKAHAVRYGQILAARGKHVEFICRSVNKNSLQDIVQTLSYIVENFEDCVFDLTGGEDLYLVAMGIVFHTYPDRNIQMHRFNIRNNTLSDCDHDGATVFEGDLPPLTVEENIRIYGGDVVYEDMREGATRRWPNDAAFKEDVDLIWDICKKDVRGWNANISVLATAEDLCTARPDPLTTVAPAGIFSAQSKAGQLLRQLEEKGILTCRTEGGSVRISYKNALVKQCLLKAGQALEMKIWRAALDARSDSGRPVYDDVVNGVVIDWDGDAVPADDHDTENEIDVMMMHGMVPVFVSCKNGHVDKNELYKLHTVATYFGGKYAKKVLVATALGSGEYADYIRQRAQDMDIRLVTGLQGMNDEELQRVVRSFWSN